MPTKHRVALTDDVYEALMKLKELWGLESPNQVIRELIKRVTPSMEELIEGAQGVTPSEVHGVTPLASEEGEGVTPSEPAWEEAWSPLCNLWDKIRDKITYNEYMYNEFRKLLEGLLPKFNSNELIEEFEACGLIEVHGNTITVKK